MGILKVLNSIICYAFEDALQWVRYPGRPVPHQILSYSDSTLRNGSEVLSEDNQKHCK